MSAISQALGQRSFMGIPRRGLARTRRLTDLAVGQRAEILHLNDNGNPAAMRRLFDLGFRPGALVVLLRRSPLGDPAIYQVVDYEIALRRDQADQVEVRELP